MLKVIKNYPLRIGKKPIYIDPKIKVSLNSNQLLCSGPLGEKNIVIPNFLTVNLSNDTLILELENPEVKLHRSLHGTIRQLVNNTLSGLLNKFEKTLEIKGVGYTVVLEDKFLVFNLGHSHLIYHNRNLSCDYVIFPKKDETIKLLIKNSDKQILGEECAKILRYRKPNLYVMKGIFDLDKVYYLKKRKK